ncbi:MAG: FkbM family methyltransferase [Crocinitomicaceae bacterium]|nr:FkbM family methyltransferase [Crocinitomicaceae bacterium]MDG2465057.1 FkbM family methyltransferase [Crocinitomicaceae bacterium]
MKDPKSTYRSTIWQHRLISFFRNIDFPGFRKLSLLLPKWLLPKVDKVGEHILKIPSGLKLWINPSKDLGVERSLFETGTYERGTLNFIEKHLQKSQTFIDVGANIGLMSMTAKKTLGNSGQVWAFEANPRTFEIMEKNFGLNNMNSIHSFECGLGKDSETLTLYDNWSINRGAASTVVQGVNAESIDIKILPFDAVATSQGIKVDMMKIDVEGMELAVLTGAEESIRKDKPILIIEFSAEREVGSRKVLYDKIESFGLYSFYKLKVGKERTSRLVEIGSFSEVPKDDNVFCLANKKQ